MKRNRIQTDGMKKEVKSFFGEILSLNEMNKVRGGDEITPTVPILK